MASEGEDIPAELDSILREDADVMIRQVSSPDFRRRIGGWIDKHELGMTEGTSNMARELVKDMVREMQRGSSISGTGAVRRDLRKLSHLIHDADPRSLLSFIGQFHDEIIEPIVLPLAHVLVAWPVATHTQTSDDVGRRIREADCVTSIG